MAISNILNLKDSSHRFERKFVFTNSQIQEVEAIIRLHPFAFLEIFYTRFVNNIYLDSFDKKAYLDNVIGTNQRFKIRIRWYGDLFGFVEKPVLEIKTKRNALGSKISFPLSSFHIEKGFSRDDIKEVLKNSSLPENLQQELACLEVSLLNRYKRKYFQSHNKDFRFTLDTNLRFYNITGKNNNFLDSKVDNSTIILELKYNKDKDRRAQSVINHLPSRLGKNSKYAIGVESLNFY